MRFGARALVLAGALVVGAIGQARAQAGRAAIVAERETAELRSAWANLKAAEARWAETRERIATLHAANGWSCGYAYSEDFRVVLEAQCPNVRSTPWWSLTGNASHADLRPEALR